MSTTAHNRDARNLRYYGTNNARGATLTTFGGTGMDTRNVREAMIAGKLAYGTTLTPLQFTNPITGRPETMSDHFAVVRTDNGQRIGKPVGASFRKSLAAGQNDSVFPRLLDPLMASGLGSIIAAGTVDNGAKCWMQARVNRPDAVIVPRADDRVGLTVFVLTAHDGSTSVHVGPTAARFWCNNMLAGAIGARTTMRMRHSKGLDAALQAAREFIAQIGQDFDRVCEVFRGLAGRTVNEAQIRAFVDVVFPPPPVKPEATPVPVVAVPDTSMWDDGPTSPDVGSDLPMIELPPVATVDFASLLSRPARITATVESDSATVARVLGKPDTRRVADNIVEIFERGGQGGDLNLPGVRGTGWAMYNALTEYLTHHRGASDENRANTLLFQDPGISGRALDAAVATVLA